MTREEFLAKAWKSYPKISDLGGEFLLGRVVKLEDQKVRVKRDQKIETIEWSCIELSEDDRLGPSCPAGCLVVGDVIAFRTIKPGWAFFICCLPTVAVQNLTQSKQTDGPIMFAVWKTFLLQRVFTSREHPFWFNPQGSTTILIFWKSAEAKLKELGGCQQAPKSTSKNFFVRVMTRFLK